MAPEVLRRFLPGGEPLVAFLAEIFSTVDLELVVDPVVAADVQLAGVLAILKGANIGTKVAKDVAPANQTSQLPKMGPAAILGLHLLPRLPVLHLTILQ